MAILIRSSAEALGEAVDDGENVAAGIDAGFFSRSVGGAPEGGGGALEGCVGGGGGGGGAPSKGCASDAACTGGAVGVALTACVDVAGKPSGMVDTLFCSGSILSVSSSSSRGGTGG